MTSSILHAVVGSPSNASAVPSEAADKAHHNKNGTGFVNPWDSYKEQNARQIVSAILWRMISGKANKPDTSPPTVPVRRPDFLSSRKTDRLRATWLGHACYYVEFPSGLRVLFDPVFEPRCSPFTFMGPKRYTEQPCSIDDLPYVDAVIISHSHYDHLSNPTVTKLAQKHKNVQFFVPLGNKVWFNKLGIHNVTELDWWEERELTLSSGQPTVNKRQDSDQGDPFADSKESDIAALIGCLPCQHTSGRTPFNKSHTLWASWSVQSGGKKLWFGGDTGYRTVPEIPKQEWDYGPKYAHLPTCPAFKQIGELRGPFDLGLIPIGAYDPRFIMSPMHANPYDSVNIFRDTKCQRALGIHWGTWVLTEEEVLEPPKVLKQALSWKDIPEEGVFDVCDIGESREY